MQYSLQQLREIVGKIPKDLVIPRHNEKGHFYEYLPTHEIFPSVTTKSHVLNTSGHLKKWAAQCAVDVIVDYVQMPNAKFPVPEDVVISAVMNHNDIFKDAGDIGTQGHGVIERYLKEWLDGGVRPKNITDFILPDQTDIRITAICRSAEKFFNDFRVEPVASELFVANEKDKYAGTLDSLLVVTLADGTKKFVLGDWKTSNSINKPEYAMQVSAYNKALWMMTKLEVDELWIIRLDKEYAKYEILCILHPELAYQAFVIVGQLYDIMNSNTLDLAKIIPRRTLSLSELNLRNGNINGGEDGKVRGTQNGDQTSGRGTGLIEV